MAAIQKNYLRQVNIGGSQEGQIQSLTGGSTATQVSNLGTTVIATTNGGTVGQHAFVMADPRAGYQKTLVIDIATNCTRNVWVKVGTGSAIFGTTANNLVFSTGAGRYRFVQLVGLSTARWAIASRSTGVTTSVV